MSAVPRRSNRVWRVLRHRWLDARDARRLVGAAALQRLGARVTASERRHSGEIRICIEAGLPLGYLWRGASVRERAVAMFGKLGVWDTEHDNGVLIYLLLAERAIEIVADRGLARRVEAARWAEITATMAGAFAAGRFEDGLDRAIDAVDALLVAQFPIGAAQTRPNELPDAPFVA